MLALVTMETSLLAKCFQRLAIPGSVRVLHKDYRTVSPQNFSNYESMKQEFRLEIPEYFNFAKDVLDEWTNVEKAGKRPSNPAFWWINGNGEEVRWSFEELGSLSRKFANILTEACSLQRGDRVIVILPKIPEWWLANIACLRTAPSLRSYKFKSLKHCVSAGEPINPEVTEQWRKRTGLDIYEGYGQTETVLICGNFKGMKIKPGSMGKPSPAFDVKILDVNGNVLPPGQEGDIGIQVLPNRPFGLFAHYIDSPTKTASTLRGNFYITGDRGYVDEDGYFWFVARADDIILSSGYRIGPFEVESALIEHPAVVEAAVVSSPDPIRGEVVKAFIVLAPDYMSHDQEQLKKEIQEHVKKTTAPYKYPRKVEFVQELPKTISGKIKRNELRKKEWETI
ncbi:acyl-coenzyme A synthetase ACSM3, mitochondrial [Enhydra lutris kenyoni]|uniref:medium-chain acyl-CoA ligase n=1 Tax=Enhydra lutris kenyoni TaxID=391180 RepID=A0A2Y9JE99_ENHLU|nr:acyl-coenzyme A synthetase ACSM3, mitochondrial [Enhydra lutris kenyoni]